MCEQVLAKADAFEALDASISTLKYLRGKEDINLQIEAAVAFSGQHGVVAESEFATRHRHRVAPRRIDDTPENAVQFGLQAFYRKEFLQVVDAQIQLLQDNWEVAFKIIEPAVTPLKPPYDGDIISCDVSSLIELFPNSVKPDQASLEVELQVFRTHCNKKQEIDSINNALNYCLKFKELFPLTLRCLKLVLTAPVTSASSERSFSKLKLIKTLVRSTMGQGRLQSLVTLVSEKDLTDQIDLDLILSRWMKLRKKGRVIRL